jgi:hypothetical protein
MVIHQQAQPLFSLSRCISMGSEKSPLNSSDSSCANAFLAMTEMYQLRMITDL